MATFNSKDGQTHDVCRPMSNTPKEGAGSLSLHTSTICEVSSLLWVAEAAHLVGRQAHIGSDQGTAGHHLSLIACTSSGIEWRLSIWDVRRVETEDRAILLCSSECTTGIQSSPPGDFCGQGCDEASERSRAPLMKSNKHL